MRQVQPVLMMTRGDEGALSGVPSGDVEERLEEPGGGMTYIIAEPCIGVKDAACVEVCPVDCIYEGDDQFYIHPDECIDCGACEPECPVQAIFPDTDVPAEWTSFIEKNAAFFE